MTYRWSFSPWPSRGFPSVHVWVQISPVSSGQPCGWIRAHPSDLMLTKLSFKRTCLQNAFKLWCWRRLLRVPWTAKRSNQSIPKEINPEYSLKALILKLKLQYFGHLMRRADSFEKTLMLEGRRRGRQRMRWLDGIIRLDGHGFQWTPGVGEGQGGLVCWVAESDTT